MIPWHCRACGRSGEVEDHVVCVFHKCESPPRRIEFRPRRTPEEARRSVWVDAFVDAIGPDALLRPIDDDSRNP